MKKQFARAMLAAALLCGSATAAMMLPATTAMAEQKVSRKVGEALNAAIKAAQAKDYATATQSLQAAEAVSDKTDYDTYKIEQIRGYIAIQQQDYATATRAYEAMVISPAFANEEDKDKKTTLHNAALLSAQAQHWPQVIADSKQLEALNGMDDKTYAVLAQAYYFTKDVANAKQAAQKSVDMAKAAGQQPQQAALEIIMSAQAKGNDQASALKTLETLAVNYGSAKDWGQLIDHALGTRGIKELDALYLYRLRFLAGATSSADDYTIAAGIALHNGYPTEAKSILEKGLASGKISRHGRVASQLAQARRDARADARSLSSIARQAERSKSGEQDVKLAEDYWGYGRYADAEAAARRALQKGRMRDSGEGTFILGIALVAQNKTAEAQQVLAKVDGSAARAAAAHLWDLYAQHKAKLTGTSATSTAPAQN
jgi:hypothetical protein